MAAAGRMAARMECFRRGGGGDGCFGAAILVFSARAAQGGSLAGSRPGFSQKKPEKIFLKICKLLPQKDLR